MDRSVRRKALLTVLTAVFLGLLPAVRGDVQVTSCVSPQASPAPNEPDQPSLPDAYRMKMEMTQYGSNETQYLEEIVDTIGNRAVIRQMEAGIQLSTIFSYATQEIFSVIGSKCTTTNLTTDMHRYFLWDQSMHDGRYYMSNGASALFFGDQIVKVYKGKKTIRGIPCDWWQSCFSVANFITNATIDYFFSERSWTTPSAFRQVPVRYEVNGIYKAAFHLIFDIFDFLPEASSDPTVFQTPPGMVCTGRKNSASVPPFMNRHMHFRQEEINLLEDVITHTDVWYDMDFKLVRVDHRDQDLTPPLDTTTPLSEIHDFNLGVRYVKDLLSGQCYTFPLSLNSIDANVNMTEFLANSNYVMTMKQPMSIFFINSNMTYVGQRRTRDALCDVFIRHFTDYDFYKNGSKLEATAEVYFLADGWVDVPNDAFVEHTQRNPVRVYLNVPKVSYEMVYNVIELDTERPDAAVFDITDCYNDASTIHFRVKFPGPYRRDTEHMVKITGRNALARSMQVNPLRVGRLSVDYDASYLYLSGVLVDRAPSLVQFTYLPNLIFGMTGDASWGSVESPAACSDLCARSPDFTCLSFEYCPDDRGACRLSRRHVSDGSPIVISATCHLYSRTVNVTGPPELTLSQAWSKLWDDIKSSTLSFHVIEDNQMDVIYTGVDAEITFGQLHSATLPTLTGQVSYSVEVVYPRHDLVTSFDVWYDSVSKFVRYDVRDVSSGPPYYTPFAVSHIHDYNTGVAYNIDTHRGNCTVTSIPTNNTLDTVALNWTSVHTSGIELLSIKTPWQLFYLDDTYKFTGQRTVRGILCDVFESRRDDFNLGKSIQHSIFQYFFQSERWAYEADTSNGIVSLQPVQLVIMDAEAHEYIIYNFYNFNDEHTSYDNFNIAPCFTDNQRIDFVLDFNQKYHPYLDTTERKFQQDVRLLMNSLISVSPLRIQNMRVTYNLDRTYITATLLGQVAPQYHFSETGKMSLYSSKQVTTNSDVVLCASNCYHSRDLICNSFNLCPDRSCYLSSKHGPDGDLLNSTVQCRHFSRLVDGTNPEPRLDEAYTSLKDVVYKGLLEVDMPVAGSSEKIIYTASDVREDIDQTTPSTESGDADLHTRFKLYKGGSQMSTAALTLSGLPVDECATACYAQAMFTCDSFSYCYTTGQCSLYTSRPSNTQANVTTNVYCDLYTRLYLDDYQKYPGQVLQNNADSRVQVGGAEECARTCASTVAFTCRSFDICLTTGDCLLRRTHVLDPGIVTSNASLCTHYSRNYLNDFTRQAHTVVPGHDDDTIVGLSAPLCAYQCAKQRSCHSFEFCSGQCRLSSVKPASASRVPSDACNLYSLTADAAAALRGTTVKPNPNQPSSTKTPPSRPADATTAFRETTVKSNPNQPSSTKTPPSRPGCSQGQHGSSSDDTGPRVGIAMGMLVAGALLGAGIVLLIQYMRGKREDDAAVELVPHIR